MPRPTESIDTRLLSKVSSMYYNQELNQQEIADRLRLSRPKVSRLLKQAHENGIVQISVISPNGNFMELESRLEVKYNLKEVIIVEAEAGEQNWILKQVGASAAEYLYRTASEGELIGVTWGRTLQAMMDAMNPKPIGNLHIVQTLGGVGPPEAKAHAADISRRLSQLLNSRLTLLPAPGIVGSVQAREVLLSDQQVRGALDLFSEIDTLYVGLGAISTNPLLMKERNEIPPEHYQDILDSKAVGDIALRFFDMEGKPVNIDFHDLVIGISPEEIKNIKTVVGIAGGLEKADVLRGALNGKLINVLITDNLTAEKILSEPG